MNDTITIRSFRAGDEHELAPPFNAYAASFVGPFAVTPESWLVQYQPSWRGPGLEADPDSIRVAERLGRTVGYAVANHQDADTSRLQELYVTDAEDADAVARALLADAEQIASSRGRSAVFLELSCEDGLVLRVAEGGGYEFSPGAGVFMTAITNLEQFLTELQPELQHRLAGSEFCDWQGELWLKSGDLTAGLRLANGMVEIIAAESHDISTEDPVILIEIAPDGLPLLLLGRTTVGECYLQDQLTVTASDRQAALRLLDLLFPRLPILLPRAQWW